MYQLIGVNFEGLADIVDRDGEDRASDRYLHTVHNCRGQRDFQRGGHAFAKLAGERNSSAYRFHVLLDDIHADTPAGKLCHLGIVEKPGDMRKLRISRWLYSHRGRQAVFDGLAQYGLIVDALAVIPDLNDNLAAGLPGGESNLTNGVLARTDAVLDILLDTMVHGVADNVHDGVADAVHKVLSISVSSPTSVSLACL